LHWGIVAWGKTCIWCSGLRGFRKWVRRAEKRPGRTYFVFVVVKVYVVLHVCGCPVPYESTESFATKQLLPIGSPTMSEEAFSSAGFRAYSILPWVYRDLGSYIDDWMLYSECGWLLEGSCVSKTLIGPRVMNRHGTDLTSNGYCFGSEEENFCFSTATYKPRYL